jgi:hypothetical protein
MVIDEMHDPAADFSTLLEYDWSAGPSRRTGDPRFDNPIFEGQLRAAVEQGLARKGFVKNSEHPDFLVNVHKIVAGKTDVASVNQFLGYERGDWQPVRETSVYHFEEGTLLIDMVDARTNRLMWRGSGTGVVQERATARERAENAARAVDKILAQFPPKN